MGTNLNKLFCSGINIWDLNRKFTRLIFWKGGRQIVFPLIKVFRYNFNWRVHSQSVFLTCGELKRLVLSCRLQNSKTSVQSVLFDDKNNSYIVRLWSFGTSWSKIEAWPNVLCSYALWNNCGEVSCKKNPVIIRTFGQTSTKYAECSHTSRKSNTNNNAERGAWCFWIYKGRIHVFCIFLI